MKILFYDIKEFELNFLLENIPENIEPYFFKTRLNESSYIDEKFLNTEAISVFVSSVLNEKVLSKFKNLKFIFLRSVGYSNIDLEYCKKQGIYVFNTPNYGNFTVAEYAFALLLSLGRKIIESKNSLSDGLIEKTNLMGIEFQGKTMGVIGAGAIGRRIINIAHGFGLEVLVYDINKKGAYNFVEFDELLKKSDFIVISCPLTKSTRKMFNKGSFSKMKKNSYLINIARGEIVDTKELYLALINKKIKGAALDVIECEEMVCKNWDECEKTDSLKQICLKKYFFIKKLMQMPNVIITPHNAYNTIEAQTRILKITLENIHSSFDINYGAKNLVLL